jgi:hypothetical protein
MARYYFCTNAHSDDNMLARDYLVRTTDVVRWCYQRGCGYKLGTVIRQVISRAQATTELRILRQSGYVISRVEN